MEKNRQLSFGFSYGVTKEQACIMCHLSSECGECCIKCKKFGKNMSCNGQACSQPFIDNEGVRWDTWMKLVRTSYPNLKKFIPKKYLSALNKK